MTRRRNRGGARRDSPKRGEARHPPVEVAIESLAAGGDGVGHLPDGRVVFVPFTAPGDRVQIEVLEERASFARGRVLELVVASATRAQPVCPVFGSCGGCAWQHIDYRTQQDAKAQILAEALSRIGSIRVEAPIPVTPSPAEYRYRSRTRVLEDDGRFGYRKRRSNALCAVSRCPVLLEPVEARLAELSEAAGKARPEGRHGAVTFEWEIALGAPDEGAARSVRLPEARGKAIHLRVGEDRLRVSPGVFSQSNGLLLEDLAAAVHGAAGRGVFVLELFAGAGFFTLGLARRFARVLAVESNRRAVDDLEANLVSAGLANVDARCEMVEETVAHLTEMGSDAVVVLDPPRSGLPDGCARDLVRHRDVTRLVYLSCDPATLARDLGVFVDADFELTDLRIFDLFPQTSHVESLAVLER